MPLAFHRLLIATTNQGKLHEVRLVLKDLPLDLVTLSSFPAVEPPEETGTTFEENARLKARYYADATGLATVAEDSGLEIAALDGAPGIQSARFGGAAASYPDKFARIRNMLRERGVETSPARFVCALALVQNGDIEFEARGMVEGTIAPEPRGDQGFGYDPIFFYPPWSCTLAEVPVERKAEVSHRGRAFRQLREYFERS